MKRLLCFLIVYSLIPTQVTTADTTTQINIVSDSSWKSYNTHQPGWETLDFHDSGWRNATVGFYYPYPPSAWWPGTAAVHMWDLRGSYTAYFRKSFVLTASVKNAVAKIRVDDGYYFYVNGAYVDSYTAAPWGYARSLDITSYLHAGENLFAIYAWDVIRINRSVLFDALISYNAPPVANAGPDQTVEQDSYAGASVTLDGSGSTDDGQIEPLTYTWTWTGGSATGVSPTVVLPLGATTVALTVYDGEFSDTDTVDIAVVDTTEPTINSVVANPDVLWPPNHKMVEVTLTVDAYDICDPAPTCQIVDVTSNEPVNGPGDGNTDPDWEVTSELTVDLRAERSGTGAERVYTIRVECTDASANTATASVDVIVPHDQANGKGKGNK